MLYAFLLGCLVGSLAYFKGYRDGSADAAEYAMMVKDLLGRK